MKNAKRTIVVVALIALMAIPAMFAYFTDTESKTNEFTVGSVAIELTEPSWNEEAAELVVPGDKIAKDPTVKNVGESPAYVFIKVEGVPTYAEWTPADGWKSVAEGSNVYYYADPIEKDRAVTLFTEVTFSESWTAEKGESVSIDDFNIDITAYAVQSENFNNGPVAAWNATFGAPVVE